MDSNMAAQEGESLDVIVNIMGESLENTFSPHPWSNMWTPISQDGLSGWVTTLEEAEDVRKDFERHTSLTFLSHKKGPNFGQDDSANMGIKSHFKIRFRDMHDVIPDDGVPFVIKSWFTLGCMFGSDFHRSEKRKRLVTREELKPHAQTERIRRSAKETLRVAIDSEDHLECERRIYIKLPSDAEHMNTHQLGELAGFMNRIDSKVSAKIEELARLGVKSVGEMHQHLNGFVNNVLFPDVKSRPSLSNAAFFPSDVVIRNHMYMAKRRHSTSKMPLKFAANLSMLFREIPNLADRYSAAKRAGFQAVEVSFPYECPVEKLVEAKETEGLEQVLINSFPGDTKAGDLGLAAIPGREKEFQETLELSIQYCTALKCKRMHVMAGVTPDCTEGDRPALLKTMEDTFLYNLQYATERLRKEGILALIEPINTVVSKPGYFLSRQDQAVDFIKKVGHPNLKLQMDLFHVQMMQGNITNTIKEFFPYIGHMQMAQVPHRNEPSADGEVNYDFVLSFVENLGYDGWIGAEYMPAHEKTEDTLQWLEKYI